VGDKPRQRLGHHGPRSRIKRCELVSKRIDSGFRRNTLRFDPLEVRLRLREFSDERVPRRGGRVVRRLFFAGRFHLKVSEIQLRIASQARVTRGAREHLGLAVMSGEWIQHLHVRFSEIVCVSGDDDKIVNERRRCDQTVLYRHRFTGLAQFSQKLCPSKARERIP
jgi:hypothetical protein